MNFDEYQKKAHQTAQYPIRIRMIKEYQSLKDWSKAHSYDTQLSWVYPTIGLPAEVGELMNLLKKVIRDDSGTISEERMIDIRDELGDIQWYIAEICTNLDIDLNEIAENNIKKLQLRLKNNQIHGNKRPRENFKKFLLDADI